MLDGMRHRERERGTSRFPIARKIAKIRTVWYHVPFLLLSFARVLKNLVMFFGEVVQLCEVLFDNKAKGAVRTEDTCLFSEEVSSGGEGLFMNSDAHLVIYLSVWPV